MNNFRSVVAKVRQFVHKVRFGDSNASAAEIAAHHVCNTVDFGSLSNPAEFVDFLRRSFGPVICEITDPKPPPTPENDQQARVAALVDILQRGVPGLTASAATIIGRAADGAMDSRVPFVRPRWTADAGLHTRLALSGPRKGRILSAAVRTMRPKICLDIGTAYGLSALFLGHALRALDEEGHLQTLEIGEPQAMLASARLSAELPHMCTAHAGTSSDLLARVLQGLSAPVDLVFHDGGHKGEYYVRDFDTLLPHMAEGGLIIFDDIRWEDERFGGGPARTYEGWQEAVQHPSVHAAVEVDRSIGVLQIFREQDNV